MNHSNSHSSEIETGKRFKFGKNWANFHNVLNEDRIQEAEKSLTQMLECEDLQGKQFLDAGSGSGLFSLAARRLGATVFSFDFDPDSVRCTQALRSRYFEGDSQWKIEQGSVLDQEFMNSLGRFDIVYSWGVLHHTGEMWKALDIAGTAVKNPGKLFIMIYLDRGWKSIAWRWIKRTYCSGLGGEIAVLGIVIPYFAIRGFLEDLVHLRNPTRRYREHYKNRGMSRFHDWIDWIGGYPYEFASPTEIEKFYAERGFVLRKRKNTEYVFEKC